MRDSQITLKRQNQILLSGVKTAASFTTRLRGLMFYRTFPPIPGLLLYPCNRIHTFWMNFPLDLIYLDRTGNVLKTVAGFLPAHIGPKVKHSYYILETPAGTIKSAKIETGDHLLW